MLTEAYRSACEAKRIDSIGLIRRKQKKVEKKEREKLAKGEDLSVRSRAVS